MKHLLKMSDLSPAELHHILDVAEELKAEQKAGTTPALLKGRSVALMFSKNSTRTRTSFEVGVYQLGGLGNYMNAATELQSGRGEPLKDTAPGAGPLLRLRGLAHLPSVRSGRVCRAGRCARDQWPD